jgi:hypothetical protein
MCVLENTAIFHRQGTKATKFPLSRVTPQAITRRTARACAFVFLGVLVVIFNLFEC